MVSRGFSEGFGLLLEVEGVELLVVVDCVVGASFEESLSLSSVGAARTDPSRIAAIAMGAAMIHRRLFFGTVK